MIYAGFWQRFFAQIIDFCILFLAVFLLTFSVGFIAGFLGISEFLGIPEILKAFEEPASYIEYIFYIVSILYQSFFLSSAAMATPGRRALGLVVIDINGKGLGFGLAFWRSFLSEFLISAPLVVISVVEQNINEAVSIKLYSVYILWFLFIILMQLFTAKRQTLYDIIAGTIVIIKPVGGIQASSSVVQSIRPSPSDSATYVFFGFDANGYIIRHSIVTSDLKLNQQGILIGRDESKCDFILTDKSVSRVHARLTTHFGELYLEDLNSTNQTKVNGNLISAGIASKISHGDVINLGDVELTLNS